MRDYELIYIAQSSLDATNLTALIERVNGFVTTEGGAVVKVNQWGLRQLSYPIRKFRDGYYVFCMVQLEASSLARVEQRLRLVEDILRYLLVRADEGDGKTPDRAGGADMASTEETASVETASASTTDAVAMETPATTEAVPAQ